jgi:hypothetical protein
MQLFVPIFFCEVIGWLQSMNSPLLQDRRLKSVDSTIFPKSTLSAMHKAAVQSPLVELREINSLDMAESTESSATAAEMIGSGGLGHEDDIFFDTIGVQFHFETFIRQLLAHLVVPLFPFIANVHGQVDRTILSKLGAWVSPVAVCVMLIAYCMVPNSNANHTMRGAYIMPLVYFLQHRFVIALKYGSLSRTEYQKFMDCTDKALCASYIDQMQLFLGWYNLRPLVVRFELAAASARIGARINEIDILIENPASSASAQNQLRAWNAFMRGHDVIDFNSQPCKQLRRRADGSYALSVYDFCEGLLLHSTKADVGKEIFGWVSELFNWINLAIPFLLMLYYRDEATDRDIVVQFWMVVFYIWSTLLNLFYAKIFFVLLYVAVVDVLRQKSMFNDLNNMIRLTDIMVTAELSTGAKSISAEEKRHSEMRVAEILSIKPSVAADVSKYTRFVFEVHDRDSIASTAGDGRADESASKRTSSPPPTSTAAETPSLDSNAKRTSVLGERIYKDNEYHMLPRISFDESHNIVAWTHARLVMQNFGERFHFRLELYVIAAMAMLVVMMALGLLNLGLAQHRLELFFSPWFLQTLLSVSMCIVFLVVIMQTGACVNDTLESHSQTMCSHALRLNRKVEKVQLRLVDEKDESVRRKLKLKVEKLNDTIEKLESMRAVIDTNTQLKPFKIFGFTAQSSLTMSILTTALSFYGILFSMLSNTEGQALAAVGA